MRSAKDKLTSQYSDIRINGAHHGFFSEQEETAIIRDINEKNTDILIVGMGVPAPSAIAWHLAHSRARSRTPSPPATKKDRRSRNSTGDIT